MPDQPLYLNIPSVRSSCSALWRFISRLFFCEYYGLTQSVQIISDCHAPITVFPSSVYYPFDYFFPGVLLLGSPCCVSSASLPCLTVSPILSTWYFFTGLLSTDYSLSVWSALWCTFMICMRLRNPFIRYPLL